MAPSPFSRDCSDEGAGSLTPDEIRAEIERLGPWFHCVDLGHGVRTKSDSLAGEPPDHPARTWPTIARCFPEDMTGQSLLDVGCNGGFYAVEAKRRGAARVLGIDAARHHVRQTLFVAKALGLDIEVLRLSVYDLDPDVVGRFDVTLALGVIYHCKHPVLALERLFEVTKTTLVLESAILPGDRFPTSFPYPLGGLESTLHPLAFVENAAGSVEAAYNWFLPSPSFLEAVLKHVGFPEVTLVSVADERVVLVARKPDRPAAHLASRIEWLEGPATAAPGAEAVFRVRVENRGALPWPATEELEKGRGPVRLGAHLFGRDGAEIEWDYGRASLPASVAPGETTTVEIRLRAPSAPGSYVIELDLVAEHWAWFEDLGSRPLRRPFEVA